MIVWDQDKKVFDSHLNLEIDTAYDYVGIPLKKPRRATEVLPAGHLLHRFQAGSEITVENI